MVSDKSAWLTASRFFPFFGSSEQAAHCFDAGAAAAIGAAGAAAASAFAFGTKHAASPKFGEKAADHSSPGTPDHGANRVWGNRAMRCKNRDGCACNSENRKSEADPFIVRLGVWQTRFFGGNTCRP